MKIEEFRSLREGQRLIYRLTFFEKVAGFLSCFDCSDVVVRVAFDKNGDLWTKDGELWYGRLVGYESWKKWEILQGGDNK